MKNAEFDKRIQKMKEVILAIHRSAGELDTIVGRMENVSKKLTDSPEDMETMRRIIESEIRHRKEMNGILEFDILDAKEDFAWEKLIQSVTRK